MKVPSATVFLSYSHEDESHRKQLVAHLAALERAGEILCWHDRKIIPGSDWAAEISKELSHADIILALVSSDFLASEYCTGIELKTAIERHNSGRSVLIPIVIRPVLLAASMFAKMEALPSKAKPVSEWANSDTAWKIVAEGILQIARVIEQRKKTFLEKVMPEILFAWYARRLRLIESKEGFEIARNLERADARWPELGQKIRAFREELRDSMGKAWNRVWELYDWMYKPLIGPLVLSSQTYELLEALVALNTKEREILEQIEKANLKPSFFGLPTSVDNLREIVEIVQAQIDNNKRFVGAMKEFGPIVREVEKIGDRSESDDFEEPEPN
jgi:hypothetical protein